METLHKMKKANIFDNLSTHNSKPIITVLFETNFTKEIRISLQKDVHMKEHKTSYPIVIEIIEGNIDFGFEQQTVNLTKGDLIALESNIPHDLKAKTNSIIRLTLSKQDNVQRVKKVTEN